MKIETLKKAKEYEKAIEQIEKVRYGGIVGLTFLEIGDVALKSEICLPEHTKKQIESILKDEVKRYKKLLEEL